MQKKKLELFLQIKQELLQIVSANQFFLLKIEIWNIFRIFCITLPECISKFLEDLTQNSSRWNITIS